MSKIPIVSRREALKLLGLSPLLSLTAEDRAQATGPNVLVLVFDTLTAKNVSLHGYRRETTPNLARFAEKCSVFHQHYSSGSFTTPGTASLLTGTYPWTHRAFQLNGSVEKSVAQHNIFQAFGSGYHRAGFSHNLLATYLMYQFQAEIDEFILGNDVAFYESDLIDDVAMKDFHVASNAYRVAFEPKGEEPTSIVLDSILEFVFGLRQRYARNIAREQNPDRNIIAHHNLSYYLEDTIDWIADKSRQMPQPFLGYFHLWPPHAPYAPPRAFKDMFEDGWGPDPKPEHFFSDGVPQDKLDNARIDYDEYIAFVDAQFGRLVEQWEADGLLDNTWVVFTSDHGEMFERGILAHLNQAMFDPIIRVPLLIHAPGQHTRQDVFTPTASVDVLPTLLHVTGQTIPEWAEGQVLPPYREDGDDLSDRPVFAVDARANSKFQPLTEATIMMRQGRYKLAYYLGYTGYDGVYELYDIETDPEELNNLYDAQPDIAGPLRQTLLAYLDKANSKFG